MSERKRAMSSTVWDRKFGPELESPEGHGSTLWQTWEHKLTLEHDLHKVWSVIEAEGQMYVTPGYHVVNMIGYVITEKPWTDEDMADNLFAIW